MKLNESEIITTDHNIGIFLDTMWEESDLDTVLYDGDNPVGTIAIWEKDENDHHVFHVRQGNSINKMAPVDGSMNLRWRLVHFMGRCEMAIDLVAA